MFRGVSALLMRMLREDALRLRSQLGRLGFLVLTILPLFTAVVTMNSRAAAGLDYFRMLIWLNLGFLMSVSAGVYASAISEEREQGTLGLLKMTGVSRLAILLGKSTSWLLITFLFLLIQLPFLAVSVTMGGVSLHQVLSATVSIGAFAVLLCNFGLICSLVCTTTRIASFMTGFWMGAYLLVPPFFGTILGAFASLNPTSLLSRAIRPIGALLGWLGETSVIRQLWLIPQTGYGGDVLSFQVVSNILGGGIFFGLSWVLFERLTRNLEPVAGRPSLLEMRINFWSKSPKSRRSLRVWSNPFVWQEYHFVRGGAFQWYQRWLIPPVLTATVVGFIYGIAWWVSYSGMGTPWVPTSENLQEILIGLMFWSSIFFFVVESLLGSSRLLGDDYREGTLSLLLLLPMRFRRIQGMKLLGEMVGLGPYLVWIVTSAAAGLVFIERLFQSPGTEWDRETLFAGFTIVAGYVLLYQVIVWYSVHVKRGAFGLGMVTMYIGSASIGLVFLSVGYLLERYFDVRFEGTTRGILTEVMTAICLLGFNLAFPISTLRRVRRVGEKSVV